MGCGCGPKGTAPVKVKTDSLLVSLGLLHLASRAPFTR